MASQHPNIFLSIKIVLIVLIIAHDNLYMMASSPSDSSNGSFTYDANPPSCWIHEEYSDFREAIYALSAKQSIVPELVLRLKKVIKGLETVDIPQLKDSLQSLLHEAEPLLGIVKTANTLNSCNCSNEETYEVASYVEEERANLISVCQQTFDALITRLKESSGTSASQGLLLSFGTYELGDYLDSNSVSSLSLFLLRLPPTIVSTTNTP
ncbi:hypothetical protein TWF281_002143 [Arthrobotrys megalospora]